MVRAQILFAAETRRANPAADPRIDGNAAADDRGVGVGADAFDHAGDLMTERERQGASGADVELLVAAEGEIAILQVQIGMAHAATLNAHQHFAAAWRWALDDGLAERLPVGGERLAASGACDLAPARYAPASCRRACCTARARASETKPSIGCLQRAPWAQVRCREEGGDGAERPQALTQHLALLTERSLGNGFKELAIARRRSGKRSRRTSEDVTFGGGTNGQIVSWPLTGVDQSNIGGPVTLFQHAGTAGASKPRRYRIHPSVRGRTTQQERPLRRAHDNQFFWMMQSPPAAFSALHILVAFSADAKGPTRAR